MANRNLHEVKAPESEMVLVLGSFVTAGTGAPTSVSGQVATAGTPSTGQIAITFRDKYFQCYSIKAWVIGTAGTRAEIEAFDLSAQTATVQLRDTDGAAANTTGETVFIEAYARNSKITRR